MLRPSALLVVPALVASSMGGYAADAGERGAVILEVAAVPARVELHGQLTLEARVRNASGAPIDAPAAFSWGFHRELEIYVYTAGGEPVPPSVIMCGLTAPGYRESRPRVSLAPGHFIGCISDFPAAWFFPRPGSYTVEIVYHPEGGFGASIRSKPVPVTVD